MSDKLEAAARLARLFHETYERLAPEYSYKTRKASAVPWNDVPDNNKRLMIAVAGEVRAALDEPAPEPTKLYDCDDPDLPNPVTGYDSWLDVQMRDPKFRAHFAVAMQEYRAENPEPAPDTAIERRPEPECICDSRDGWHTSKCTDPKRLLRPVDEIARELRHELFTDCIHATQLSVLGKSDEVQAIYDLAAKRIADALRAERGTDD